MKQTLTDRKDILAFLNAQSAIADGDDRQNFDVTFFDLTDKIWSEGKQISDACCDPIESHILFAIVNAKPIKLRCDDSYDGGSNTEDSSFALRNNDFDELIRVKVAHIAEIRCAKPIKPRIITDPMPEPIQVRGLQYRLEGLTGPDGTRGFAAGCNKVYGKHAIAVLEWLAKDLGYTLAKKPQAKKPVAAAKPSSKV